MVKKKTDAVIISNVIHVIYQKVHKRQRYKSYAVQGVNEEGRMLAFLGLLHGCHTNSHHHNIRCTSTRTQIENTNTVTVRMLLEDNPHNAQEGTLSEN